MDEGKYDHLLKAMPDIAKAVNSFTSESVQVAAFEALVASFDPAESKVSPAKSTAKPRKRTVTAKKVGRGGRQAGGVRKAAKKRGSPSILRDLNLRPPKIRSFKDFATEKAPNTHYEKFAVAVYWLTRLANVEAVTVDHLYTCYKDVGWRQPADFDNTAQVAASRRGWLDTANMESIQLSIGGENLVEHDLPSAAKS